MSCESALHSSSIMPTYQTILALAEARKGDPSKLVLDLFKLVNWCLSLSNKTNFLKKPCTCRTRSLTTTPSFDQSNFAVTCMHHLYTHACATAAGGVKPILVQLQYTRLRPHSIRPGFRRGFGRSNCTCRRLVRIHSRGLSVARASPRSLYSLFLFFLLMKLRTTIDGFPYMEAN